MRGLLTLAPPLGAAVTPNKSRARGDFLGNSGFLFTLETPLVCTKQPRPKRHDKIQLASLAD
jgi:hypothetical protein